MPRGPRPVVAGLPHHVTQRGVDGMAIFRDDTDRRRFCHLLKDAVDRHAVALHAYVLMDNHVHLLLTPARTDGLGRAMKRCDVSVVSQRRPVSTVTAVLRCHVIIAYRSRRSSE